MPLSFTQIHQNQAAQPTRAAAENQPAREILSAPELLGFMVSATGAVELEQFVVPAN